MDMNSIYEKSKQAPWQEMNGQVIVLTPRLGNVHELNETAAYIWQKVDGSRTGKQIVSSMFDEFEVNYETIKNDFIQIVDEMTQKGMLVER